MGREQPLRREFSVVEDVRKSSAVRQRARTPFNVDEIVAEELEFHPSDARWRRSWWIAIDAQEIVVANAGQLSEQELQVRWRAPPPMRPLRLLPES